jgi:hypothetical protein
VSPRAVPAYVTMLAPPPEAALSSRAVVVRKMVPPRLNSPPPFPLVLTLAVAVQLTTVEPVRWTCGHAERASQQEQCQCGIQCLSARER